MDLQGRRNTATKTTVTTTTATMTTTMMASKRYRLLPACRATTERATTLLRLEGEGTESYHPGPDRFWAACVGGEWKDGERERVPGWGGMGMGLKAALVSHRRS